MADRQVIADFARSMGIATSGLRAQAGRMRVISENIANADSTASTAGGDPYRRKVPTFSSELDRSLDANVVALGRVVAEAVTVRWSVGGANLRRYDGAQRAQTAPRVLTGGRLRATWRRSPTTPAPADAVRLPAPGVGTAAGPYG